MGPVESYLKAMTLCIPVDSQCGRLLLLVIAVGVLVIDFIADHRLNIGAVYKITGLGIPPLWLRVLGRVCRFHLPGIVFNLSGDRIPVARYIETGQGPVLFVNIWSRRRSFIFDPVLGRIVRPDGQMLPLPQVGIALALFDPAGRENLDPRYVEKAGLVDGIGTNRGIRFPAV